MADTLRILKLKKNGDNNSHLIYVNLSCVPVKVLPNDGFVEAGGLFKLVLLHEEHVSHVQLPSVTLVAKLHRLPKYLFNLCIGERGICNTTYKPF